MPTNIKENGFETLIVDWLRDRNGYEEGTNADYDREHLIDKCQILSERSKSK